MVYCIKNGGVNEVVTTCFDLSTTEMTNWYYLICIEEDEPSSNCRKWFINNARIIKNEIKISDDRLQN